MNRKTLFWTGLFAVLFALGAGFYLLHRGGSRAVIYVDGEIYRTVELDAARPEQFTVETPWGWNTVRAEQGRICVTDADCPGHDCVQQGFIDDGMIPIVCLPHRLVIQIEG